MPLSTPAKVTIGVLIGAATVTGVGMHLAKMRRDAKRPCGRLGPDDGDSKRTRRRDVVYLSEDSMISLPGTEELGFAVNVGDRNLVVFSDEVVSEFAGGRRVAEVSVSQIVGGKVTQTKAWSIATEDFFRRQMDTRVTFEAKSAEFSFIADRAGLFVVSMLDHDGAQIVEGLVFLATSKPETAAA